MRYFLYIGYNLAYQAASFWLLLFAGTYINQEFIPKGLLWRNNLPRTDSAGLAGSAIMEALILLLESAGLVALIYGVNRWFWRPKSTDYGSIGPVQWTLRINIILFVVSIAILMWGSFATR